MTRRRTRPADSADLALLQALLDHERSRNRHLEAERDAWRAKAYRAAQQRDKARAHASQVVARVVNGSSR